MDSAIGAICLAFYYTVKLNQLWVPIINCKREELRFNPEIVMHLEKCEISIDTLCFYDELKAQYPSADDVEELALIDHNKLDLHQSEYGSKVTRVIDHHVESGAYEGQLVQKQVRLIGSACSLVALLLEQDYDLFWEDLKPSESKANMAYLCAAAVVLDSYFFDESLRGKKWTDEDTQAHNFLMQYADVGEAYWSPLNEAKFDVQASLQLGLRAILMRDYKNYDLETGTMGVAVSAGLIETLTAHFGSEAFGTAMKDYLLEKDLGMLIVMATEHVGAHDVRKNILVFDCAANPAEQALKTKAQALVQFIAQSEDLALADRKELTAEQLGGHGTATYFVISNPRVSRKVFERVIKTDTTW